MLTMVDYNFIDVNYDRIIGVSHYTHDGVVFTVEIIGKMRPREDVKRDERVVLIGVSADNRIRRLRARSLAEGREDMSRLIRHAWAIASENRFRAAADAVNVDTRSPEFFGSRESLRLLVLFPLRHRAPARAAVRSRGQP